MTSDTTNELDLESRIKHQRAALIEKLNGLKTDVRREAIESRSNLKARLSELTHLLKWGVADDWQSVSAPVTNKLEQWLAESGRQLVARYERP